MFKVVAVEVFTATDEVEPTMEGNLDLEGKGVSASYKVCKAKLLVIFV
jgi:hypothetical protein